jgi:hypothetical protein
MLGPILTAILVLALIGALPLWSHSRSGGYYLSDGVGLIFFDYCSSLGSWTNLK